MTSQISTQLTAADVPTATPTDGIWTMGVGDLGPGTCEATAATATHVIDNASSPAWGTAQLPSPEGSRQVTLDRLRVSPRRLARGRKLTIRFRASTAASVRIQIHNGGKRRVKATLDADAGSNRFVWSGKSNGRPLPIGRYVIRASVPGSPGLTASFRIVGRR